MLLDVISISIDVRGTCNSQHDYRPTATLLTSTENDIFCTGHVFQEWGLLLMKSSHTRLALEKWGPHENPNQLDVRHQHFDQITETTLF